MFAKDPLGTFKKTAEEYTSRKLITSPAPAEKGAKEPIGNYPVRTAANDRGGLAGPAHRHLRSSLTPARGGDAAAGVRHL